MSVVPPAPSLAEEEEGEGVRFQDAARAVMIAAVVTSTTPLSGACCASSGGGTGAAGTPHNQQQQHQQPDSASSSPLHTPVEARRGAPLLSAPPKNDTNGGGSYGGGLEDTEDVGMPWEGVTAAGAFPSGGDDGGGTGSTVTHRGAGRRPHALQPPTPPLSPQPPLLLRSHSSRASAASNWQQQQQQRGAASASASALPSPAPSISGGDRLAPVFLWVHGGGFIGSSFSTDSIMLSSWVKEAGSDAPPFLVMFPHYSLSPEVVYPTALNELVALFSWLRARCDKVVIGGDSAGGNLCAALILRCIAEGVPLPDGLLLAYPALNLNNSPSPSRAMHLQDPLVPIKLLQRLAAAYIGPASYGKPEGNNTAYIHPLLAADAALALFPPTYILSGGADPLLDDAIDLNTRMRRLGVPGELLVLRRLPHGFLNFPSLEGVPHAIATMREWALGLLLGGSGGGAGSM